MKETYSISLKPKFSALVLGSDSPAESKRVSRVSDYSIRVVGEVHDELYCKVLEADALTLQSSGEHVALGCQIARSYTKTEIDQAKLFRVLTRYQYGAAEEFGTWYTDDKLDPDCGIDKEEPRYFQIGEHRTPVGAMKRHVCALSSRRVGPMHFPFLRFVKRDVFSLWGGETVISERFAHLIENGGYTGARLLPIWNTKRGAHSLPDLSACLTGQALLARAKELGIGPSDRQFWLWIESPEQLPELEKALWEEKQLCESRESRAAPPRAYVELKVESSPLAVTEETASAEQPFGKPMSRCNCTYGRIQRFLCSGLAAATSSWDHSDICQTDLYFGARGGLFHPWRELIVSKRLFDAMRREKIKGFGFEIVELV